MLENEITFRENGPNCLRLKQGYDIISNAN